MPIFKANGKLVYYAHVPKCGGTAVGWYLNERFGPLAFSDRTHTRQTVEERWSQTSPQHIDRDSLSRLFPDGFFDASFAIVRHPVTRIVSAYHFQVEVEESVPASTGFSEWLSDIEDRRAEDPFAFDNHIRPMAQIVPEGAEIFYTEHGLDGLVPWFDALTGTQDGPRAVPRFNEKGAHTASNTERATPTEDDLERLATLYADDFTRFGYRLSGNMPAAAAPVLTPEQEAERDAWLKAFNSPMQKMRRKIGSKLGL